MKQRFKDYLHRVVVGYDQAINATLGGSPMETISARAWRHRHQNGWKQLRWLIDLILFWDTTRRNGRKLSHCEWAFLNILEDEYMPGVYK